MEEGDKIRGNSLDQGGLRTVVVGGGVIWRVKFGRWGRKAVKLKFGRFLEVVMGDFEEVGSGGLVGERLEGPGEEDYGEGAGIWEEAGRGIGMGRRKRGRGNREEGLE
ncbi:hypothetical protein ACQ86N_34360 [Puia sp. P3]|uniref:hypothetical protein n=1 Tax=Puia sp. P3 TaxID=3423952 RepID=UPI003D670FF9